MLADSPTAEVQLSNVRAMIVEVLPQSGIAYAIDDASRTWTVPRRVSAQPLASYEVGRSCLLTVAQHRDFSVVERCELAPRG